MAKEPWDDPEFDDPAPTVSAAGQTPAQRRYAEKMAQQIAKDGGTATLPKEPWDSPEYDDPPARVSAVPLTPERQAKVSEAIAKTSIPQKGILERAGEAIEESNQEVGQQLADRTLFGVTGRVMRSAGVYGDRPQVIPEPGKGDAHRPEDYLPVEGTIASLPAAAADMGSIGGAFGKAGQTIGQAPASLARALGARQGQAAVRPGLQVAADAAGTGALYSGADTAMRGGTPGEVLASMPEGALANVAMSHLPAIAGRAEGFLSKRVAANDLRPIKQMSKKGTLDKELIQFGGGDPEKGAQEMLAFVQRENLGPILRQKGAAAVNQYEAAKSKVYEQDLKPIYEHAYKAEPNAAVPFDEIATALRANIRKKGGNEHRLVEKAIDEIKARTELVSKTGEVPLETLLTNARDFQAAGHAGVVNYDAPPESKVVMRHVGQVLRGLANEKVADIYRRHPEAAYALQTGGAKFNIPEVRPSKSKPKIRLYRAAEDDDVSQGVSFAESHGAAASYLENPGFGGKNIYYTDISPKPSEVLDLRGMSVRDVARKLGHSDPGSIGVDEWLPRTQSALDRAAELGYKWARVDESFPRGTESWQYLGGVLDDGPTLKRFTKNTKQPSDSKNTRGEKKQARYSANLQEYAADVPRLLAEGNKRYSDYAKLEPMVRQASVLKAGEKKWGLMNMLGHGMSGTVGGAAGYLVGGFPGAVAGTAAVEAGRATYPYAVRAANATAGAMSGPALPALIRNPTTGEAGGSMIAGAILARYGQKGLDEYEKARARLREAKGR